MIFSSTARRSFERFLKAIADLSMGAFTNKNNGDPLLDRATSAHRRTNAVRDLERLGDSLLARHTRAIADAGMEGKALAGELPFRWKTDFNYPWLGGWLHNQEGKTQERNLIVMIPGRDRSRAVLMADHYDTAYMEDEFHRAKRGDGPRLATPGADDNCSATAAAPAARPFSSTQSRGSSVVMSGSFI